MSVILAIISLAGIIAAVITAYNTKGAASFQMGVVCFVSLVMSVVGIVLGIIGIRQPERFNGFPVVGIIANVAIILCIVRVVYAGVVVL